MNQLVQRMTASTQNALYSKTSHNKSTNHGTDFKWRIYGSGRFRELEYHYNSIEWVIIWGPNKAIDIGSGRHMKVVGQRFYCSKSGSAPPFRVDTV